MTENSISANNTQTQNINSIVNSFKYHRTVLENTENSRPSAGICIIICLSLSPVMPNNNIERTFSKLIFINFIKFHTVSKLTYSNKLVIRSNLFVIIELSVSCEVDQDLL